MPVHVHNQGSLVFGSVLLGVWLFFALPLGGGAPWVTGGIIGVVIGTGMFASRAMQGTAKAVALVALGLFAGVAVAGALVAFEAELLLSLFLALLGAVLVANSLQVVPEPAPQAGT